MASLSVHVLDTAHGRALAGVAVSVRDGAGTVVGAGVTDADGRIAALAPDLTVGDHTVAYELAGVFPDGFLRAVTVAVRLEEDRHHHLPLLASAWSATSYLGT